ncbi:MAG: hypothetical protein ACRC41_04075 [Sarcina sp.]
MKKIILVIVNYFIVGIISYTILFSVLITIAAVILQNYIMDFNTLISLCNGAILSALILVCYNLLKKRWKSN